MSSLMSAKTILAPSSAAAVAVARNVSGVVMTSSPGPTSAAAYATCSAAVPEVTETAGSATPASSPICFSNVSTYGPVVSQSPDSTSCTTAMSASLMD